MYWKGETPGMTVETLLGIHCWGHKRGSRRIAIVRCRLGANSPFLSSDCVACDTVLFLFILLCDLGGFVERYREEFGDTA